MTSIHVNITVAPENVEKFLEAFKPVYEAVTAEPNCKLFQVYHKAEEPGVFRFVENWDASVDWLINTQLKKEYYAPYVAATEPLWIKPREIDVWQTMPGTYYVSIKKDFYFP